MAWVAPATWTTGQIVTAANLNEQIRDNMLQTAPAKVTTAWDVVVATGANALQRMPLGAVPYGGTTTNVGNAYSLAAPTISALVAGLAVSFMINVNSTGAATLNWSGTGAIAIKKANGNDATNLKANVIYTVRYNGTNFCLQGEGGYGDATAADILITKTATVDGEDITGTMPNRAGDTAALSSSVAGTTLKLLATNGYRDGVDDNVTITDADFVAANILTGANVLGINGSALRTAIGSAVADAGGVISVTLGWQPRFIIVRWVNGDNNYQCAYIDGWNPASSNPYYIRDVATHVNPTLTGVGTQLTADRWTVSATGFTFDSDINGATVYYYAIE